MLSINHSSSLHVLGSPVAAPEPGVHCEQQRGGQQAAVGGRVEAGQGGGGEPARAQQVPHHTGPGFSIHIYYTLPFSIITLTLESAGILELRL